MSALPQNESLVTGSNVLPSEPLGHLVGGTFGESATGEKVQRESVVLGESVTAEPNSAEHVSGDGIANEDLSNGLGKSACLRKFESELRERGFSQDVVGNGDGGIRVFKKQVSDGLHSEDSKSNSTGKEDQK